MSTVFSDLIKISEVKIGFSLFRIYFEEEGRCILKTVHTKKKSKTFVDKERLELISRGDRWFVDFARYIAGYEKLAADEVAAILKKSLGGQK